MYTLLAMLAILGLLAFGAFVLLVGLVIFSIQPLIGIIFFGVAVSLLLRRIAAPPSKNESPGQLAEGAGI